MTELEGAIITEIGYCGNDTAFKVRQSFRRSLSSAWSGSAGAIYPAVRRLIAAGYLSAAPTTDGRGTKRLAVTKKGHTAHRAWMLDATAAIDIGADPFRLRGRLWVILPKRERKAMAEKLLQELEASLKRLAMFESPENNPLDQIATDLAIQLQRTRQAWLQRNLRD